MKAEPFRCAGCNAQAVRSTFIAHHGQVKHEGVLHSVYVPKLPVMHCGACGVYTVDERADETIRETLRIQLLEPPVAKSPIDPGRPTGHLYEFPKVYECVGNGYRVTFNDYKTPGRHDDGSESKYGLDDIVNCSDFRLIQDGRAVISKYPKIFYRKSDRARLIFEDPGSYGMYGDGTHSRHGLTDISRSADWELLCEGAPFVDPTTKKLLTCAMYGLSIGCGLGYLLLSDVPGHTTTGGIRFSERIRFSEKFRTMLGHDYSRRVCGTLADVFDYVEVLFKSVYADWKGLESEFDYAHAHGCGFFGVSDKPKPQNEDYWRRHAGLPFLYDASTQPTPSFVLDEIETSMMKWLTAHPHGTCYHVPTCPPPAADKVDYGASSGMIITGRTPTVPNEQRLPKSSGSTPPPSKPAPANVFVNEASQIPRPVPPKSMMPSVLDDYTRPS